MRRIEGMRRWSQKVIEHGRALMSRLVGVRLLDWRRRIIFIHQEVFAPDSTISISTPSSLSGGGLIIAYMVSLVLPQRKDRESFLN